VYAALRTLLGSLTVSQSRYLFPLTTHTYHSLAKEENFTPKSTDLPSGVQAHWLGDRNAKVTLVYFHGGGYVQPVSPSHLPYLDGLVKLFTDLGHSFSCVVLAHTLAPEAEYPSQLAQAAELLHYLLETEHRSPSSLIIGGDSAGGNLTLSVLSHMLHPHPGTQHSPHVPKITLSNPIKGALLLSPWVSFDCSHPSYEKNAESDMLSKQALTYWASLFLGSSKREGIIMGDSYSEPLLAEPNWWSGAHNLVDEVMIWGGGGEVFEDSIKAFASKFIEGWTHGGGDSKKVNLVISPRLGHDEPISDVGLRYKTKSAGAIAIEDWVKARLKKT
jgi:acetyl esterase/lipase